MKKTWSILCLLSLTVFTKVHSQDLKSQNLNVETVNGGVASVNMYDQDCIHVVDGLVTSSAEKIPAELLAHFEQAASKEKLNKLGFDGSQCVMLKSSADLDIENYVYRQVHAQVQQIGIQYKIPIAVNGELTPYYTARRSQLMGIKPEQIKQIKFLDKATARAKYGDKIVFGLIEITV